MSFEFHQVDSLQDYSHPIMAGLAILHKYDVTIDQNYAPEFWVTRDGDLIVDELDAIKLGELGWRTDGCGWYHNVGV